MANHIRTFRSKKLNQGHVKLLNEAIRRNVRGGNAYLNITYKKSNGDVSERKVKPISVRGTTLFFAHCNLRDKPRSFRVERVEKMEKTAFWAGFEKRASGLKSPQAVTRSIKQK